MGAPLDDRSAATTEFGNEWSEQEGIRRWQYEADLYMKLWGEAKRDLDLLMRNRNDQLVAMAHKHRDKETALLRVCDAVTLAEAKRIAREAIQP
jgi:hypothetical protein